MIGCSQPRVDGESFCPKHLTTVAQLGLKTAPKPEMVCPQCGERGQVRVKTVKQKRGVSGGKAAGALLTGGLSLFATGLSRKAQVTEAHCSNCSITWHID